VQVKGIDEVEMYIDHELAPGGFAWLVPTKNGKGLAGMMTQQQPKKHLKQLLTSLKAQGKIISADVTCGYGVIPLVPLPRTYANRILAVGEVAGQVKPTTGGGIYYGLLCADVVADVLKRALATSDFSASRLSYYQKQWQAKLKREQSIGYLAHRIFRDLGNKQLEMLLNFANSLGIPKIIAESKDFSFDWHGRLILNILRQLILGFPAQGIASFSKQHKKHSQTIPT
ncbi:MAG: hypothetical protein FJZ88_11000, partial [Chloroflexi bacterium]|nr:hypothetical protein [Chloroflexota bacterium]